MVGGGFSLAVWRLVYGFVVVWDFVFARVGLGGVCFRVVELYCRAAKVVTAFDFGL